MKNIIAVRLEPSQYIWTLWSLRTISQKCNFAIIGLIEWQLWHLIDFSMCSWFGADELETSSETWDCFKLYSYLFLKTVQLTIPWWINVSFCSKSFGCRAHFTLSDKLADQLFPHHIYSWKRWFPTGELLVWNTGAASLAAEQAREQVMQAICVMMLWLIFRTQTNKGKPATVAEGVDEHMQAAGVFWTTDENGGEQKVFFF